jgi:hypothetical protein
MFFEYSQDSWTFKALVSFLELISIVCYREARKIISLIPIFPSFWSSLSNFKLGLVCIVYLLPTSL